jgi:hypothetical protein
MLLVMALIGLALSWDDWRAITDVLRTKGLTYLLEHAASMVRVWPKPVRRAGPAAITRACATQTGLAAAPTCSASRGSV